MLLHYLVVNLIVTADFSCYPRFGVVDFLCSCINIADLSTGYCPPRAKHVLFGFVFNFRDAALSVSTRGVCRIAVVVLVPM